MCVTPAKLQLRFCLFNILCILKKGGGALSACLIIKWKVHGSKPTQLNSTHVFLTIHLLFYSVQRRWSPFLIVYVCKNFLLLIYVCFLVTPSDGRVTHWSLILGYEKEWPCYACYRFDLLFFHSSYVPFYPGFCLPLCFDQDGRDP